MSKPREPVLASLSPPHCWELLFKSEVVVMNSYGVQQPLWLSFGAVPWTAPAPVVTGEAVGNPEALTMLMAGTGSTFAPSGVPLPHVTSLQPVAWLLSSLPFFPSAWWRKA